MERVVTVARLEGDWAWVAAGPVEACGSCGQRGLCTVAQGPGKFRLRVENRLHALPGERVVIAVAPASLLSGALVAYGLPLCGFLAGILAGAGFGTVAAVITGLGGLAAGGWLARRRLAAARGGGPAMLRRAGPADGCGKAEG